MNPHRCGSSAQIEESLVQCKGGPPSLIPASFFQQFAPKKVVKPPRAIPEVTAAWDAKNHKDVYFVYDKNYQTLEVVLKCPPGQKKTLWKVPTPTFPEYISAYTEAKVLYLSGLGLKELPKEVGGLKYLVSLDLSDNPIAEINSFSSWPKGIRHLWLNRTFLTRLDCSIYKLRYLEKLQIQGARLLELTRGLGYLRYLKSLRVNNNYLKDLPRDLADLERFKYLDISGNQFRYVPEFLVNPSLTTMVVDNNPFVKEGEENNNAPKPPQVMSLECLAARAAAESKVNPEPLPKKLHAMYAKYYPKQCDARRCRNICTEANEIIETFKTRSNPWGPYTTMGRTVCGKSCAKPPPPPRRFPRGIHSWEEMQAEMEGMMEALNDK